VLLLALASIAGCRPVALVVMGDSTSLDDEVFQGYANHLEREFGAGVVLSWPQENGRTSATLLDQIQTWEPVRSADILLFNAGLHDIAHLDGLHPQVDRTRYVDNLALILEHLDELGVEPVWRSTTPVPADYGQAEPRIDDDVVVYNFAAAKLMDRGSAPVLDLYGFTRPNLEAWQEPKDVHFNTTGNRAMAEFLADELREAFGEGLAEVR